MTFKQMCMLSYLEAWLREAERLVSAFEIPLGHVVLREAATVSEQGFTGGRMFGVSP